jgi:hypothetical protein
MGIALAREKVTCALAEVELAWVEATAPVRARAITSERTKSFMNDSLFGYSEWAEREISLDTPDNQTLGFTLT